jgi:uncharacterized membrane protein YjjP (DUF1212 family)
MKTLQEHPIVQAILAKYPKYQVAIFLALIANAVIYAFTGTWGEALDAVAWLVLLALFQLETHFGEFVQKQNAAGIIHILRTLAIAAVAIASAAYLFGKEWLDAINAALWFAVIAMLELELRFPHLVTQNTQKFKTSAIVLYSSLVIMALVWAAKGSWLDAYDALLWIAAFATIEMDMLKQSGDDASGVGSNG